MTKVNHSDTLNRLMRMNAMPVNTAQVEDLTHPNVLPGSPASRQYVNWWDLTKGKRGKGGISGAEPIE